jgi:hypothetical protein
VTTEHSRVELTYPNDPWLQGVVNLAVVRFAQRAGLDEKAQAELAAATGQACADTFKLLTGADNELTVVVEDFADRVEVTLNHRGEALPSAGLETFAGLGEGGPEDLSGLALLSRVDRVLYETTDGTSRTILVKYTSAGPK